MSRVTRGIRQPSPVPNGFSGTGTVPGGYPCLTGTYHGYPGVPIPVLHLISDPSPLSPLSRTSPPKSGLRLHPSDFVYALQILSPTSLRISLRDVHCQAPPWHRVGST